MGSGSQVHGHFGTVAADGRLLEAAVQGRGHELGFPLNREWLAPADDEQVVHLQGRKTVVTGADSSTCNRW